MDAPARAAHKNVIILGFHKSGTSATAGVLNILGVNMGRRLRGADGKNPRGYYEDARFLALNDDILKAAGGSAWDPPAMAKLRSLRQEFAPRVHRLVEERSREACIWGWKATTTCLTIDHYLPHLVNPHFVVVFRNPLGIAPSAVEHTRGKVAFLDSIHLAGRYNEQIVAGLKDNPNIPRHFVSFEKLVAHPLAEAEAMAAFLGVDISAEQRQKVAQFIIPRERIRAAKTRAKVRARALRLVPGLIRRAVQA